MLSKSLAQSLQKRGLHFVGALLIIIHIQERNDQWLLSMVGKVLLPARGVIVLLLLTPELRSKST